MKVYRFRSMEYLLGNEYQELEKQAIYFASPEELNDPMEGLRDIVWRGDRIVWTNFFKHFIYSLHASYFLLRVTGDYKELDEDDIPMLGNWNQLPTPQYQRLYDDIWNRFLNLPKMQEIIEALANTNHTIRYRELGLYLRLIHSVLLDKIEESAIEHGLRAGPPSLHLSEKSSAAEEFSELILRSITLFKDPQAQEKVADVFQIIEDMHNEKRISIQLNHPIPAGIWPKNVELIYTDFPKVYLDQVEKLLWPNWYTACFTKDYHNSSVWGHYGDKHRGACLIFESVKTGEDDGLELYQEAGKSVRAIRLSELSYVDKPEHVDFFQSIGRITVEQALKQWYTDEEGNISDCASHVPRDSGVDSAETIAWRKGHWDRFYRDVTNKTKDWEYEQEYRLILEDGLRQFDEKQNRTLSYDFNSLKGIIFGIKTSDEDKLRIIKIIENKCEKYNRTDFKYYQAEYSPEDGYIRKYETYCRDSMERSDLRAKRIDEINQPTA